MYEKVKASTSLKEETKIQDFPSTMVSQVTKMKGTLKMEGKHYQDASNTIEEKTRQVDEHQKLFFRNMRLMSRP